MPPFQGNTQQECGSGFGKMPSGHASSNFRGAGFLAEMVLCCSWFEMEGFFCTHTMVEKWDQVRPGMQQVHEDVHSVGQEPGGRKQDFLEQEGPGRGGWDLLLVLVKSHFIVLYPINPLKNFNKGNGIHSLKDIVMSRPQGLSLPAILPWPQLFTSILVAVLLLPSKHRM